MDDHDKRQFNQLVHIVHDKLYEHGDKRAGILAAIIDDNYCLYDIYAYPRDWFGGFGSILGPNTPEASTELHKYLNEYKKLRGDVEVRTQREYEQRYADFARIEPFPTIRNPLYQPLDPEIIKILRSKKEDPKGYDRAAFARAVEISTARRMEMFNGDSNQEFKHARGIARKEYAQRRKAYAAGASGLPIPELKLPRRFTFIPSARASISPNQTIMPDMWDDYDADYDDDNTREDL